MLSCQCNCSRNKRGSPKNSLTKTNVFLKGCIGFHIFLGVGLGLGAGVGIRAKVLLRAASS